MNLNMIKNPKVIIVAIIIVFAAIMRLVPHYPNFTPIAAIALFGGAHLGKKWISFLIPMMALFISDLFLGFHSFMIPVYVSFALIVFMGTQLNGKVKVLTVLGASVSSSVIFFLITNFAVWAGSSYYHQTLAGLIQSYTMALPFFNTSLLGDLFYSSVLFGSFYFLQLRYPSLEKLKA